MRREIRILEPDDLDAYIALREVGFFSRADKNDTSIRQRSLKRFPYTQGAFVDGNLASAATMLPFDMNLAGQNVQMAGLASVMTAPEYRRQGHVKALLHAALEQARVNGSGWSLEYPFDPRYYEKFGWQSVNQGVLLELPVDMLPSRSIPEAQRWSVHDLEPIKTIYKTWASQYNLSITRTDADLRDAWQVVTQQPWEDHPQHLYMLEGAYCFFDFSYSDSVLKVRDYAYSSPEGRQHLLAFWRQFQGQAKTVRLFVPAEDPLALHYAQRYAKPSSFTLQARIVDVALAFGSLKSPLDTAFNLRVHDDFCDWNDGVFRLELSPQSISVNKTQGEPDVELDIRTLPLLLSGALKATAAQQLGLAHGQSEFIEALCALSGHRQPFLPVVDYF